MASARRRRGRRPGHLEGILVRLTLLSLAVAAPSGRHRRGSGAGNAQRRASAPDFTRVLALYHTR